MVSHNLARFVIIFCFSLVVISGVRLIFEGITDWGVTFIFVGVLGMIAILWELEESKKEYERRKKTARGGVSFGSVVLPMSSRRGV